MLFDMIQLNYACVVICILFFGFVVTDKSFERMIETLFLIAVSIILCLVLFDNLELVEKARTYPTLARKIYSAIGYSLRPVTAICITLIINNNMFNYKKLRTYIYMFPLFVNILVCVISIWNGCVFAYTPDNQFYRGPLGVLPFVIAGLYILCMFISTLKYVKTRCYKETFVIFLISLLCVAGSLLQVIFKFTGFLNISCAMGVLFYFLYLHVNIYSKDPLTGAYNRRIFYLDVEKAKKKDKIIVALDLNDLKRLNDEQGHFAGDQALLTLSKTITKYLCCGSTLYRMGGDEFVILCSFSSIDKVEQMMQTIEEAMNKKQYSFAYGIVYYHAGQNIDSVYNYADERMYSMKSQMKMNNRMKNE